MRKLPLLAVLLSAAALLGSGCAELSPEEIAKLGLPPEVLPTPPKVRIGDSMDVLTSSSAPQAVPKADPAVLSALFELLEKSDSIRPDLKAVAGTPFEELLKVGSPDGFRLRNRYLYPGVPLAEALAADPDPALRERLVRLARWERSAEVRATALIALARLKDLQDERVLNEALAHHDPAVRFGAMEALLSWGHPEKAVPLLKLAAENDVSPLLRVYAAGGMARLGGAGGLEKLRGFLSTSPDWVGRAMAAHALGDYGEGKDYDVFLDRLDRDGANEFLSAEYAIAALKIFGRREAAPPPVPAPGGTGTGNTPGGPGLASSLTADLDFMLEPIVITAPREHIAQETLVDPRINALLLRLLEQKSALRPEEAGSQNSAAALFAELTTLTGHMLSLRYSELGFLLTEGLAGVKDFGIQNRLEAVSRSGKNPPMRAAALVALGHAKDDRFFPLFQEALRDVSLTVRLGGLESVVLSASPAALFTLGDAAQNDPSFTVKGMAAAEYWQRGNLAGREALWRMTTETDWYARAEAVYHLGRLGGADEYRKLMDMLGRETDPIVRAELALALVRLGRFK
ncbi:HEAT repeat domain-containing protein [bacterium]|nr:MAG: HEAT repeat domain-containing protein [bacterium]